MVASASIKMDELLTTWLGSDAVYESVMRVIENLKAESATNANSNSNLHVSTSTAGGDVLTTVDGRPPLSPKLSIKQQQVAKKRPEIPPFFRPKIADVHVEHDNPQNPPPTPPKRRVGSSFADDQTWDGIYMTNREGGGGGSGGASAAAGGDETISKLTTHEYDSIATVDGAATPGQQLQQPQPCIAIRARELFQELGVYPSALDTVSEGLPPNLSTILYQYERNRSESTYHSEKDDMRIVPMERFERITKELCNFPTFFHKPLYDRILLLWERYISSQNIKLPSLPMVTFGMFHYFWDTEMAPYDKDERFFRLIKQPSRDYITRDDFFPYIKELLSDHPGLEFLSDHAEFQDKYAVTVITRIFYSVNLCHSGRITVRQVRKSDLLSVFQQVDEEEDINKVTKYFSYEHFYVLYCRFWELDHDRDYKITREDLLKYGEHSLSHMIVDRIFDAAPRPFESVDENGNVVKPSRDYLTYEDFIFFMLSEEDKANEYSARYWFSCVDVDGDDRLNNMEMRSFYAVQLHRMQCMGHEVVPFEDMLCQMMDMIKPANSDYLVVEDFLQPHCSQVAGALFDALFNVNKYVCFEQRDPFLERQKREDEFDTDWDRFACIDYNRLAMEEEQREEEAMEVDWVTMDEEEDSDEYNSLGLSGSSEAPF
ncbi:hypothetical protein ACHAWC_009727 [Mediolabrus comicus]